MIQNTKKKTKVEGLIVRSWSFFVSNFSAKETQLTEVCISSLAGAKSKTWHGREEQAGKGRERQGSGYLVSRWQNTRELWGWQTEMTHFTNEKIPHDLPTSTELMRVNFKIRAQGHSRGRADSPFMEFFGVLNIVEGLHILPTTLTQGLSFSGHCPVLSILDRTACSSFAKVKTKGIHEDLLHSTGNSTQHFNNLYGKRI